LAIDAIPVLIVGTKGYRPLRTENTRWNGIRTLEKSRFINSGIKSFYRTFHVVVFGIITQISFRDSAKHSVEISSWRLGLLHRESTVYWVRHERREWNGQRAYHADVVSVEQKLGKLGLGTSVVAVPKLVSLEKIAKQRVKK